MKELLSDNIAVLDDSFLCPNERPKLREVNSILVWVSAFITYTAIIIEAQPHHAKDLLAYMRIIVRESCRSSDKGWISYNRIFRQNAASDPSLCWAKLNTSLHSAFCVRSMSSSELAARKVCSHCNSFDHNPEDCTKAQTHTNTDPAATDKQPASSRPIQQPKKGSRSRRICLSWNSGKCMLPGSCEYSHECATCHEIIVPRIVLLRRLILFSSAAQPSSPNLAATNTTPSLLVGGASGLEYVVLSVHAQLYMYMYILICPC